MIGPTRDDNNLAAPVVGQQTNQEQFGMRQEIREDRQQQQKAVAPTAAAAAAAEGEAPASRTQSKRLAVISYSSNEQTPQPVSRVSKAQSQQQDSPQSVKRRAAPAASSTSNSIRSKRKQQQPSLNVPAAAEPDAERQSATSLSASNTTTTTTTDKKLATQAKEKTQQQIVCAACSKPIRERYLLEALDKQWHEDCLKCACCDCRLGEVGSTLFTQADKILCRRDFLRIFGQPGSCAACKKSIPPYELVMRANLNAYHMECFACQQCQYRFCVGDRFHLTDLHRIICTLCHNETLSSSSPSTTQAQPQQQQQVVCPIPEASSAANSLDEQQQQPTSTAVT